MTFQVIDIARAIHHFGPGPIQTTVDRIRNFTKLGLITPAGEPNPGTGRARKYSLKMAKRAILIDALLNAGIYATRAAAILDGCPDLSQGRATIRLGPGISIVIEGRRLCQPLEIVNARSLDQR